MYEHIKVIVSGDIIEVYEMEKKPFNPSLMKSETDEYNALDIVLDEEETKERNEELRDKKLDEEMAKIDRKAERRAQTVRDARNKIKRLALSNFKAHNSSFLTLTVAKNEDDVKKYDNEFKKFIRKIKTKYKQKDLKYIAVREFQKRGAIHYHLMIDLDLGLKIPNWFDASKKNKRVKDFDDEFIKPLERELANIWTHGFVDIKPITHVDNVGAYLVKYMDKDFTDSRLEGCKLYLNSKGLEKPLEYKGEEAEAIIQAYGLGKEIKKAFTNSYINEYLGTIVYKEYNLKRPNGKLPNKDKNIKSS